MSVWQPELVVGIDGKYFGLWRKLQVRQYVLSQTLRPESDIRFRVRHCLLSQTQKYESDITIQVRHFVQSQTLPSKSDITIRVKHYDQSQTLSSESDITSESNITICFGQIVVTGTIWRSATELGTNGAHLGQKFKRIIEGGHCQKLKRIIEGEKLPEIEENYWGEKTARIWSASSGGKKPCQRWIRPPRVGCEGEKSETWGM